MTSQHKFINHTADIAVEISAASFEELIKESLRAFNNALFDYIDDSSDQVIELKSDAASKEELLVTFLNEINYLITVKKMISKNISALVINSDKDEYTLTGKLECCPLTGNIKLNAEIKSVTYHKMEIKEMEGQYSTLLVFDI